VRALFWRLGELPADLFAQLPLAFEFQRFQLRAVRFGGSGMPVMPLTGATMDMSASFATVRPVLEIGWRYGVKLTCSKSRSRVKRYMPDLG